MLVGQRYRLHQRSGRERLRQISNAAHVRNRSAGGVIVVCRNEDDREVDSGAHQVPLDVDPGSAVQMHIEQQAQEDLWDLGPNRSATWHAACVTAWRLWNAQSDCAKLLRTLQQ